ncbi:MAG: hypothetical protein Q9219_002797 [cf. Caloplaca sp. 3 TL-2023]
MRINEANNPRGGNITKQYRPLLQQFDSHPLIDKRTLRSWNDQQLEEEDFSEVNQEQSAGSPPTLRDQSTEQLLDAGLSDPNFDFSAFMDAQQLPGFTSRLRSRLQALHEDHPLLSSSRMVQCLQIAFDRESVVDLSQFTKVTAEHLVEAASKLLESDSVESLDLSHLRQLTETDLERILGIDSSLTTLYTLGMPQISLKCVASLWSRNAALKNIYHTEMYQRPFAQDRRLSNLIPVLKDPSMTDGRSPIKNILWARMEIKLCMDVIGGDWREEPNLRKADGITVNWRRSRLTHWRDEKGLCFSVFPVHDTLLPATKLINALVNFLHCAYLDSESCAYQEPYSSGYTMAKSIASASSRIEDPSSPTIGPLPESLFRASDIATKIVTTCWPLSFPEMQPGDAAVVIINEHDPSYLVAGIESAREKLRLAIIRVVSTGKSNKYHVESMDAYLASLAEDPSYSPSQKEEFVQLQRYWKEETNFVQEAQGSEVEELMSAAKRNMQQAKKEHWWSVMERSWE